MEEMDYGSSLTTDNHYMISKQDDHVALEEWMYHLREDGQSWHVGCL